MSDLSAGELKPALILIISGKRKSGKDYFTNKFVENLNSRHAANSKLLVSKLTLSAPLKQIYASENGIEYDKLLDSSPFKEKYRSDMIKWGEEKRQKDNGFFARLAIAELIEKQRTIKGSQSQVHVWIITDARRVSDIQYFRNFYQDSQILILRVQCSQETRVKRGWCFVDGVDNAESECGLDNTMYDFVINNDTDNELNKSISDLLALTDSSLTNNFFS